MRLAAELVRNPSSFRRMPSGDAVAQTLRYALRYSHSTRKEPIMSLTSIKEILAPLSTASAAMSDALQQAQDSLSEGIGDARTSLSKGAKKSLTNAQTSGERARRAWLERSDLVRERSADAADQASATYRNALEALSETWNRAVKAVRSTGAQAADIEERVRRDAMVYSNKSAGWARQNPHIIAAAVAVAGYLAIRSYRKRRLRRLEEQNGDVTGEVGDAANDEAVHTKRSA